MPNTAFGLVKFTSITVLAVDTQTFGLSVGHFVSDDCRCGYNNSIGITVAITTLWTRTIEHFTIKGIISASSAVNAGAHIVAC